MYLELKDCTWVHPRHGHYVLDHLSLMWQAPELIRIQGSNGSGKSLLLQMLAGQVKPQKGQRLISAGAHVALFKNSAVVWPITVLALMHMIFRQHRMGLTDEKEQIAQWLHLLELESVQHMRVSELSDGLRQRLFWLPVLWSQARIWLWDEPLSHQSQIWHWQFYHLLEKLQKVQRRIICLVEAPSAYDVGSGWQQYLLRQGRFVS